MADPPGRPPPSPTMSQRLLGKEKRHSAIHSAAERGDLEEIKAAAILDSKVVNLKGHMGVSELCGGWQVTEGRAAMVINE